MMTTTNISAETAACMGRTAWHIGMSVAQLVAMFRAMGRPDTAAITRIAIRAYDQLDAEAVGLCCPYHDHGGNPAWSCGGDHP